MPYSPGLRIVGSLSDLHKVHVAAPNKARAVPQTLTLVSCITYALSVRRQNGQPISKHGFSIKIFRLLHVMF